MLDGSKALRSAVAKVFGTKALVQRCSLHKRRNVIGYLPVARLGITGALRRSLTNPNCIESMISTVRVVTGRVKTWKDGDMKKRWIATGMIEAQRSFRRVSGHTQMANLVTVIGAAVNPAAPANYAQAVA